MLTEHQVVNGILERWRQSYFSESDLEGIEASHGAEVRRILEQVYGLTGLGAAPRELDDSMGELRVIAANQYPWLSEKAVDTLNWMLMMTWK